MDSIFNNVWDFIKDASQKAGDWLSNKLTLSKETTNLLQGKGLPEFYQSSDLAKSLVSGAKNMFIETPARAGAAASLDINITGKKLPTLTPTTQAEKFLFGSEPIKPLSQQYVEAKQSLESAGFKGASTPIAATAVFGGTLLDMAGFAGGKKGLVEQLAKETSVDAIAKILRKANVAEDIILPYAEKFAKMTKPAEIEKGLNTIEKMVSTTGKAGSALHYTQQVLNDGEDLVALSEKKSASQKIGEFMTDWYDRYYNIGKFMDDVEKKIGRKLTAEENAYIGARNFSGMSGKIENKLDKFGIILRENAKNVENGVLDNYLFNQRAIERANRGFLNPGRIDTNLAKKALNELEAQMSPTEWKKMQTQAASIYQYGNDLLKYIYEGGVISENDYKMALENNEMYVPFDVIEHLISKSDEFIPAGSKAFSVASQDLIKKTIGTELAVDSPINALIRKTIKSVDLVERNKVAQTLVDLRKLSPDIEKSIIKISENVVPPNGYGKISVLRDGIKESYAVPIEVADAMRRMNKEQADFLTRTASWGAQALRAGATSYNPLFILPNAWRDYQTATLVSKVGFNVNDWRKGLWEATKAVANKYGTKLDDSIYKRYLEDAGQVGGYYTTYLLQVPKTAKDLTKSTGKKILSLLNPFKSIYEAGKIIEMAPRLGVYQKAMSKGLTGKAAGFASREATVDFAKMGESMKIFNQWTPFVNARIQGTINIGNALVGARKSPKKAAELALKISALALTPYISSYYWNTTQFPEVWDDISDGDKSNYIILIFGNGTDEDGNPNQVIKIPKGSFAYFIDPVQDFLEWQRGKVPNLFARVAEDTIMNILPISSTASDVNFAGRLGLGILGLTPPAAKGIAESMTNVNFYTGKQIVPESMAKVSPRLQTKQNTTIIAKELGNWLNISPLKLENAIRTMTGGVGTEMLGVMGTVAEPGFKVPFVSGFKKKFTKAIGGEKEQQQIEKVQKYETKMADRKKIAKDTAQMIWNQIKKSDNPEEIKQLISDIGDDQDIKSALVKMIKREVTPYSLELLKTVSPKERAEFVYDGMKSFETSEEAQKFVQELSQNGIITNEVRTQLKILMLSGQ